MDDETRAGIVATAWDLFNSQGYRSVTMDQLSERRGMSKKTLYQYFASKEDLAAAAVEEFLSRIAGNTDRLRMDGEQDPVGTLHAILDQVRVALAELDPRFLADLEKYLPALWQRFEQFRAERILLMEHLLRSGQRAGRIKPVNPRVAVLMYLGAVQSLVRPDVMIRHGLTMSDVLDTVIAIFLQGILEPPDRAGREGREDIP